MIGTILMTLWISKAVTISKTTNLATFAKKIKYTTKKKIVKFKSGMNVCYLNGHYWDTEHKTEDFSTDNDVLIINMWTTTAVLKKKLISLRKTSSGTWNFWFFDETFFLCLFSCWFGNFWKDLEW